MKKYKQSLRSMHWRSPFSRFQGNRFPVFFNKETNRNRWGSSRRLFLSLAQPWARRFWQPRTANLSAGVAHGGVQRRKFHRETIRLGNIWAGLSSSSVGVLSSTRRVCSLRGCVKVGLGSRMYAGLRVRRPCTCLALLPWHAFRLMDCTDQRDRYCSRGRHNKAQGKTFLIPYYSHTAIITLQSGQALSISRQSASKTFSIILMACHHPNYFINLMRK